MTQRRSMTPVLLTLLMATLAMAGCQGADVIRDLPQERYPTQREFRAPLETVWRAVYDYVFENYHIRAIDRSAGFISTSQTIGKSDYIYKVNMLTGEEKYLPIRFSFNISVRPRENNVLVKLKLFEEVEIVENIGTFDDPAYTSNWEKVQSSTRREHIFLQTIVAILTELAGGPDPLEEFLKEVDGYIQRKDFVNAAGYLRLKIGAMEENAPGRAKLVKKLKEVESLKKKEKKP